MVLLGLLGLVKRASERTPDELATEPAAGRRDPFQTFHHGRRYGGTDDRVVLQFAPGHASSWQAAVLNPAYGLPEVC
jgi:hypothetical protein